MVELVTVPISFFEITIDYVQPDLRLPMDRGLIVQGLFDALKPWNLSVDDVEPHTTGKPSEQGFTFRLPLKRASFFFGSSFCRFSRDALDWKSVDETITILDTSVSTLSKLSGIVMGVKRTAVGVHLQPRTKPFMEILNPFIAPQLASLESHPLKTMAVVAKWASRKITIDGSGSLANGVFLKFERDFQTADSFEDIARQLEKDEEELFSLLGVEEDRG